MKFYCTEDIENLAAQGKKELILDEGTVLTDLARETARQLGIALVVGRLTAPDRTVLPAVAAASNGTSQAALKLGAKPKGCQHAPLLVAAGQEHSNGHQNSGGVVDQLVELVRQSASKRSGN